MHYTEGIMMRHHTKRQTSSILLLFGIYIMNGVSAFTPFATTKTTSKYNSFETCREMLSTKMVPFQASRRTSTRLLGNMYDDWRSDGVVDTMYLDEENVQMCLDEFIDSDYGQQMFGCHERPASIGVTGSIEFVELCGPEVILSLHGSFWHRRETVLGRAAMWLNARMPEITDVMVADMDELKDYDEILDDFGEVIIRKDRRSPDFNGDRDAMEYQGMDPDMRGPFPQGPMGPGTMINPI